MTKETYLFKNWQLFLIYVFLYSGITWLSNNEIYTNSFYYSAFSNQVSNDRIEELIKKSNDYVWLQYTIMPVLLLLKWVVISGTLYIGSLLFDISLPFKKCYKIIIFAELALVFASLTKTVFLMVQKPKSIQDIQYFYPFSLLNFFGLHQLPSYMVYATQQVNLFELTYWILITLGIKIHVKKSFDQSLKVVFSSYGVALCIWVLCISFIQLQFS